ncbi:MAG: ABC-F family ATP-binding cassette domain-containing protein [Actinomycetota bacterium]
MAVIEAGSLTYTLPGGRTLFRDVSFKVPDNCHAALVGANGTGKTTLLRLLSGEEKPTAGSIRSDGRIGYMRQFIGTLGSDTTLRAFLISLAPPTVRSAASGLAKAERTVSVPHGSSAQMRYAEALERWGQVGGYDFEVLWETCCSNAFGRSFEEVGGRAVTTFSGGEQKRIALEVLFRSEADVLLLDEPDNSLDIPSKRWLEDKMNATQKTILYVSHDRALLAETSHRVVTIEGQGAWTHPGSFESYQEARGERVSKIEQERRLYKQEHERLVAVMREFKRRAALNDKFATKARSMEKRITRFERTDAPRAKPEEQDIKMKLGGGRTGKIALRFTKLSIPGLIDPFSTEILYGERLAVLGPNGTGKSHFLKLLGGDDIRHSGEWKLGARVRPSLFSQLHERPDLVAHPILDVLKSMGLQMGAAMSGLKRYELERSSGTPFPLLSGGQQARFQLLLIELEKPTLLLLDEPTDNLDIDSAEALEEGLMRFEGTVVAVTHDRWFMQLFDRFLIFNEDGSVEEPLEPPY